jgi:hypothetical protein
MYNGFAEKKRAKQAQQTAQCCAQRARVQTAVTANAAGYSTQSQIRTNQWIQQNVNTRTATLLSQGSIGLIHPEQHVFRDYSPVGNVYVRKY